MGIGINAFFNQVCTKFINIKKEVTTAFLKRQGNYQIALPYHKPVNKPINVAVCNERWGVDNVDMSNYPEFGTNYHSFLTVVDYFSKKSRQSP